MAKIASLVPPATIKTLSVKDTIADHVNVLASIRAYCIGLEQTTLTSAITPNPDWFNTLSANLALAQTHAKAWTDPKTGIELSITDTLPQAVIDLGNRFKVATNNILAVLTNSNNNPTPAQIQAIQNDMTWMVGKVGDQSTLIDSLRNSFLTFDTNAGTDLTNLTSGNNSIQKALDDDNKVVNRLNADIAILQADIAKDQAVIKASEIAGGVGMGVGIVVMGLGAAASGPGAPVAILIGLFIVIAAAIEMATVISIYEKRMADAQNTMNNDMTELTNENKQIAALTLMNSAVTNLVDLNKAMTQSLSDLADWFGQIVTKIGVVAADLKEASGDMTSNDWFDFGMDIQTAQLAWEDFQSFATGWQKTVSTLQAQTIVVAQKAAA